MTRVQELDKSVDGVQELDTRVDELNHLLMCRELMQQFVVDVWCKVETERLAFLRREQQALRVDDYSDLLDEMTAMDCNLKDVGKKFILPATFTGGRDT